MKAIFPGIFAEKIYVDEPSFSLAQIYAVIFSMGIECLFVIKQTRLNSVLLKNQRMKI